MLYFAAGVVLLLVGVLVLLDARGIATFMHRIYRRLGPYPNSSAWTRYPSGALTVTVGALLLWQGAVVT